MAEGGTRGKSSKKPRIYATTNLYRYKGGEPRYGPNSAFGSPLFAVSRNTGRRSASLTSSPPPSTSPPTHHSPASVATHAIARSNTAVPHHVARRTFPRIFCQDNAVPVQTDLTFVPQIVSENCQPAKIDTIFLAEDQQPTEYNTTSVAENRQLANYGLPQQPWEDITANISAYGRVPHADADSIDAAAMLRTTLPACSTYSEPTAPIAPPPYHQFPTTSIHASTAAGHDITPGIGSLLSANIATTPTIFGTASPSADHDNANTALPHSIPGQSPSARLAAAQFQIDLHVADIALANWELGREFGFIQGEQHARQVLGSPLAFSSPPSASNAAISAQGVRLIGADLGRESF